MIDKITRFIFFLFHKTTDPTPNIQGVNFSNFKCTKHGNHFQQQLKTDEDGNELSR